jgi:hypothetical protein
VPASLSYAIRPFPSETKATLTIRPSFDVQVMKWRFGGVVAGGCDVPGQWSDVLHGSLDAGQTVAITLTQLSTFHCVEIAAKGSDPNWVSMNLHLDVRHP